MAFGFPARSSADIELPKGIDAKEAVRRAIYELSWAIARENPDGFEVRTIMNMKTWGEVVTIKVVSVDKLEVSSRCVGIQVFDWGKNRSNIEKLRRALAHL